MMIKNNPLNIKKMVISGLPYILASYMLAMGQVIEAAIYIGCLYLISASIAYNMNPKKIENLSTISISDKKTLNIYQQSWTKKVSIGLAWLIAAIIFYLKSFL